MMIVMKESATAEQVEAVVHHVEHVGARAHVSRGELHTVIGAIGDREHVANLELDGLPGVDHVVPITRPYKLASLQFKREEYSILDIGGRKIGGNAFMMIAGPCKPRTSPYSFQGLGEGGLRLLAEAREETGMPVVTELMDVRDLDAVLEVADVIQIGARNMQNYTLLTEIGRAGRPVILKRGLSAQLEELLMAAEYVLKEGNEDVILCERGIRTFETGYRFTLDLMAIPVLKQHTHLPVIVDPSHAAGRRDLVLPMSMAAAAAGADGIIVEVHPDPEHAICDGPQQLRTSEFADYLRQVEQVAMLAGKEVAETV